jgi:hypothetical protein
MLHLLASIILPAVYLTPRMLSLDICGTALIAGSGARAAKNGHVIDLFACSLDQVGHFC